jgi:hypothetical protein
VQLDRVGARQIHEQVGEPESPKDGVGKNKHERLNTAVSCNIFMAAGK